MKKDLLAVSDMTISDIDAILTLAFQLKQDYHAKNNPPIYSRAMDGKSMVMIFQKTSTRTRLSFELGMAQLGGYAAFLDWKDSNFQVGSLVDEAKCIAAYTDLLMARVYSHGDLEKIASAVKIPVINGLSDLEHPCQALADMMTILDYRRNTKVAYVGDGSNVCNSLISICSIKGIDIAVAVPPGYEPDKAITERAVASGRLALTNDPHTAVKGADFVYTDTWVSLGQEAQTAERLKIFPPYQLNRGLLPENAYAMHCLPAHRGYEITDEIIDSPKFLGFVQSENRLHVQKALMLKLLGKV